jgi:hypothetical protein
MRECFLETAHAEYLIALLPETVARFARTITRRLPKAAPRLRIDAVCETINTLLINSGPN